MSAYFRGWYFKCQSPVQTLALICAVHREKEGSACSIQMITDSAAWHVRYPYTAFEKSDAGIRLAESRFGEHGIELCIDAPGLTARGKLAFGPITPIRYDIMGPFALIPLMECRHEVVSMRHEVTGTVNINGEEFVFDHAAGYWEGDRGRSFPKEYVWTQCSFPEGSLMLSVAEIPLAGIRFTGVIGVIFWRGKEYRLATYLGARVVRLRNGEIVVRQGNRRLHVKQLEKASQPLRAPCCGAMDRTIHEHASCKVAYRFWENGRTLFSLEASNASMEYEYPR